MAKRVWFVLVCISVLITAVCGKDAEMGTRMESS